MATMKIRLALHPLFKTVFLAAALLERWETSFNSGITRFFDFHHRQEFIMNIWIKSRNSVILNVIHHSQIATDSGSFRLIIKCSHQSLMAHLIVFLAGAVQNS
jgi:hypothetical protein